VIAAYRDQDRWIAPNPISSPKALSTPPELAVRDPCSTLQEPRCRNGAGDTPKGQRRPVRPHDIWRTPTPFLTGRLWEGGSCDPVEDQDHLESIGAQEARWSRCHSKGSVSPSATIRQLADTDAINGPGGFGKRHLLSIGGEQPFGKRPSRFKRKDGVGATPKGQCRPVRPYDSWRTPTTFWNGRLLKCGSRVILEAKDYSGCVRVFKEARWSWCHSKRSASTSATIRQLEGYDAILDREALQGGFGGPLETHNHWESALAFQEARWGRRLSKGSVSHNATIRQLEGARRHS